MTLPIQDWGGQASNKVDQRVLPYWERDEAMRVSEISAWSECEAMALGCAAAPSWAHERSGVGWNAGARYDCRICSSWLKSSVDMPAPGQVGVRFTNANLPAVRYVAGQRHRHQ